MENNLKNETSPYLLQHKNNPVNWYPWGAEAFEKAKSENKPIFLSIGYSTCHWCHVMAHESFENDEVAKILNDDFISIKVDKEERPDIDSIYMDVCQAFTGSGGWPMSVFITPEQKPFFAGTYFPKSAFISLLKEIIVLWKSNQQQIIRSGDDIVKALNNVANDKGKISSDLIETAVHQFEDSFDKENGGFGRAPKFPTPHNLLFLLNYYERTKNNGILEMVEKTLLQMYKGGIFDHIGYGFSRYSTDKYFLAPHFEKMLYDNALLILSYIKMYDMTKKEIYKDVAQKTSEYILHEMTDMDGGFYSAQDADSDGVEGKYYVFDADEIIELLGEEAGKKFNDYYGITGHGNFEGKNILNLLHHHKLQNEFEKYLPAVYEYRKSRAKLHLDDKILTTWNSLMITAFVTMYRVLDDKQYLEAAKKACGFIERNLSDGDTLYVSFRDGKLGSKGFFDDYAFYIYALIHLYEATFEEQYLSKAITLCNKCIEEFYDKENSGFYLYGQTNEQLILKPKETYDGAIPSGNSIMAYNLVWLSQITEEAGFEELAKKQLEFMASNAEQFPMGHSMYLLALDLFLNPLTHIVCVKKDNYEKFPLNTVVKMLNEESSEYPILNNMTTYYVCKNKSCMPPTNNLKDIL